MVYKAQDILPYRQNISFGSWAVSPFPSFLSESGLDLLSWNVTSNLLCTSIYTCMEIFILKVPVEHLPTASSIPDISSVWSRSNEGTGRTWSMKFSSVNCPNTFWGPENESSKGLNVSPIKLQVNNLIKLGLFWFMSIVLFKVKHQRFMDLIYV